VHFASTVSELRLRRFSHALIRCRRWRLKEVLFGRFSPTLVKRLQTRGPRYGTQYDYQGDAEPSRNACSQPRAAGS